MLHIILTILKIIGWIILVILGLLVLLICVVFFIPLCYRAEGSGSGSFDSLRGRLQFSWLLHMISGHADYQDGAVRWKIRIAWKTISSESDFATVTKDDGRMPALVESKPQECGTKESTAQESHTQKSPTHEPQKTYAPKAEKPSESDSATETRYERFCKKLQAVWKKIKYTFRKICDTIKSLLQKKERLMEFLKDEVHQSAFAATFKEVKRFLKFLSPRKWNVDVHFGFEDPSLTGYTLALISMIQPFLGEHTDIRPDFENQILEGNLLIAGKIRIFYLVIAGWNLLWNKHVRATYKHIRNFKL